MLQVVWLSRGRAILTLTCKPFSHLVDTLPKSMHHNLFCKNLKPKAPEQ